MTTTYFCPYFVLPMNLLYIRCSLSKFHRIMYLSLVQHWEMDKHDKDAVKYAEEFFFACGNLRGSRSVTLLCRRVDV